MAKLEWFQPGGGVSDRQWQDVLGVVKIQADRLDMVYLHRMAVALNITNLLDRASAELQVKDSPNSSRVGDNESVTHNR